MICYSGKSMDFLLTRTFMDAKYSELKLGVLFPHLKEIQIPQSLSAVSIYSAEIS